MGRIWRYIKTVMGVIFRHPIPGVTIIPIWPDGQIVLIRRRDTGQWGLPGGLVDWGEDIPMAARRELSEETGLTLRSIRRLVGVYSDFDRDPRIHSISISIEAEVEGSFAVRDTLEVIEVKAFAIDSLPFGNLSHDHERQLRDYLEGTTVIA
jgi:8-oxo-dGTP diphosphatase